MFPVSLLIVNSAASIVHALFFRSELMWYYQNGARHIFPDAWDSYIEPIPKVSGRAFGMECMCNLLLKYRKWLCCGAGGETRLHERVLQEIDRRR